MIAPDLVSRFAHDLSAVIGNASGLLGVAVSGGPDSLALLLLAAAHAPGRVRAATVDHRLRPESADEAAFVAKICEIRAIPHTILPVEVTRSASLQAAARAARYAALAEWIERDGIAVLLTGHHADDQAETLLMRLQRASGVGGLAGIRPVSPFPSGGEGAKLCRPLLRWRRSELERIVAAEGIAPVRDPSNSDDAYDRVRMRARLAEAEWIDPDALARSAAALAEAEDALAFTAERLFAHHVRRSGERLELDPAGLPPELLRRLVQMIFAEAGAAPRGDQVGALIASLQAGRTVTLAGRQCRGGETWRFEPAPPRRTG